MAEELQRTGHHKPCLLVIKVRRSNSNNLKHGKLQFFGHSYQRVGPLATSNRQLLLESGGFSLLCLIPTADIFIFLTNNSCFLALASIHSTHPRDGIRVLFLRSPLMED